VRRLAAACGGQAPQCRALWWEKMELFGDPDWCKCFGTLTGPITHAPSTAAVVFVQKA